MDSSVSRRVPVIDTGQWTPIKSLISYFTMIMIIITTMMMIMMMMIPIAVTLVGIVTDVSS
jgi:hypothetical protein